MRTRHYAVSTKHRCFALIDLQVILAPPSLGHSASLSFVVIGCNLQSESESCGLNGFNDFNDFDEFSNSLIF